MSCSPNGFTNSKSQILNFHEFLNLTGWLMFVCCYCFKNRSGSLKINENLGFGIVNSWKHELNNSIVTQRKGHELLAAAPACRHSSRITTAYNKTCVSKNSSYNVLVWFHIDYKYRWFHDIINMKRIILAFQNIRLTSTFNIYVSWHCVADDTLKRTILSTPVSANFSVARSGMPWI